ncbi:hypothetical protein DFH09DRAFT_988905, partial [Mycena vulgaris]
MQALRHHSECVHECCFVCGPKGKHLQPPLPPYPAEWNSFIHHSKTAGLSRKLNNLFTLTAIAVFDGDFMKFDPGVSAVTLAGGRTYNRILSAKEGQHAIRWFIHDPKAIFSRGDEFKIPQSWIQDTLAGLERVNPFVPELQRLRRQDSDDDLALHIEHAD